MRDGRGDGSFPDLRSNENSKSHDGKWPPTLLQFL